MPFHLECDGKSHTNGLSHTRVTKTPRDDLLLSRPRCKTVFTTKPECEEKGQTVGS